MDIINPMLNTLMQLWYVVPFFLLVGVLKSRWFKGMLGEWFVNRLLRRLPENEFTIIKNVTLPTEKGTTQVDHIVVSKFGIFVIETKNMTGWIFGSAHQKQWTQKIYRRSFKFQNPLHQNFKHVKVLASALDCDPEFIHSVIVFVGDSKFKTDMPSNVTDARGCIDYIHQFDDLMLSGSAVKDVIAVLNTIKLNRGFVTDFKHRQHVKSSRINR